MTDLKTIAWQVGVLAHEIESTLDGFSRYPAATERTARLEAHAAAQCRDRIKEAARVLGIAVEPLLAVAGHEDRGMKR